MSGPKPVVEELPSGLTVEAFYAWADGREGRYELIGGKVIAQSAETVRHALAKLNVLDALRRAVADAGASCRVFPDGVSVRIDDHSSVEPDVAVQCGRDIDTELDLDAIAISEPLIVVEVLSPGSKGTDKNKKLIAYFQVPSIQHYLIVDPVDRKVVHHQRIGEGPGGAADLATRIIGEDGVVRLEPPGIDVGVAGFWVG